MVTLILLIAMAATVSPDPVWCLGDKTDHKQPSDQPAKESDDKEISSGSWEIEDGDVFQAITVVCGDRGWNSRTWALLDLDLGFSDTVIRYGSDACRAPPVFLI